MSKKKNGAYSLFCYLIEICECRTSFIINTLKDTSYITLDEYVDSVSDKSDLISDAFFWHDTEEGYDFWYEIDDFWRLQWNASEEKQEIIEAEEYKILKDFAKKIIESQVDLPPEFNEEVNKQFWDLF